MTDTSSPTKTSAEEAGKRLAVLIDADNTQPAVIEALLEEVALYGEAIVRRIYGDFTAPASKSWKTFLNKHSIKAVQLYGFGEQKTPEVFRNACHKFIFTEVLRPTSKSLLKRAHLHPW